MYNMNKQSTFFISCQGFMLPTLVFCITLLQADLCQADHMNYPPN